MWILECPKAPPSEHLFKVNELTPPKDCWNVPRRCFYANFLLMSDKSRTEKSLLVTSEILGLCFNKFTDDQLYSCLNRQIFPQLVRTQLYQKQKVFCPIFISFLKSTWNLEHLEKKEELHSLNISEVIDTEECNFFNARKLLLQNILLKLTI